MSVRGLAARRAVKDSLPGKPVESLDRQAAPRHSAGQDDRPRPKNIPAVEMHVPGCGIDSRDGACDQNLSPEPSCLLERPACEFVARDTRREAQVVLDSRRRARLAPGSFALHNDRPETLRRSVHGRSQPGWPRADNHRVIPSGSRLGRDA